MDDVGGFFLPQLTQLEPGMPHPPLRHPVLKNATLSVAITTSVQCQIELRMAIETLRCNEELHGPAWQNCPANRLAFPMSENRGYDEFFCAGATTPQQVLPVAYALPLFVGQRHPFNPYNPESLPAFPREASWHETGGIIGVWRQSVNVTSTGSTARLSPNAPVGPRSCGKNPGRELQITRPMSPVKPHIVTRSPYGRARNSHPVQIGEITGFSGVGSVGRGGMVCTLSQEQKTLEATGEKRVQLWTRIDITRARGPPHKMTKPAPRQAERTKILLPAGFHSTRVITQAFP